MTLAEERHGLLAVTILEATNITDEPVFNITDESNSFSITTPGHWASRGGAETVYRLQKLLELGSGNNIDLHVKEITTRGNQILIGDKDYNLSDLHSLKK